MFKQQTDDFQLVFNKPPAAPPPADQPDDFQLVFNKPLPVPPDPAASEPFSMEGQPDDFQLVFNKAVQPHDLTQAEYDATHNIVQRDIVDPFMRGLHQAGEAIDTAKVATGAITPEQFGANVMAHQQAIETQFPQAPDDAAANNAIQAASGKGDWWGVVSTYAQHPNLLPQVVTESLPASAPSLVGAAAGSVAGPAGTVAGAGLGSFISDYTSSLFQAITDTGQPITQDSLVKAVSDPTIMAKAKDYALKHGVPVAAFDALSAGIAGRVAHTIEHAAPGLAGKIAAGAAETASQAGAGMAGEAGGQVAATGKIQSPADVIAEGLGEIVPGVVEHGINAASGALPKAAPELPTLPAPTPTEPVNAPNVSPQKVPVPPQADDFQLVFNGKPVPTPIPAPSAKPAPAPTPQASQPPVQTQEPPQVQTPAPEPSAQQAPQPAAQAQPPAATPAVPRGERVVTPDGRTELDTQFHVVDASQLKMAQGADQPRDRNRAGSTEQINNMAANLDPLRLMSSREADRGAPVVDDQNTILSGNGRYAAIKLAAEKHPERYAAYKRSLAQEGHDISGVQTPVLVRRAVNLTPEARRSFAVQANASGGLQLSPAEQANIEKDYITPDMLGTFNPDVEGGAGAASNQNFVKEFMQRLPQTERSGFTTETGGLSPQGVTRIHNALFARAYGDKNLVTKATESGEDPAIRNALLGAAAPWAQMRDRAPKFDITPDLVKALGVINDARGKGLSIPDYLNQIDAFREPVSDRVRNLVSLFYNKDLTRLAAWKDVRDRLSRYAAAGVQSANAAGDMFGGEATPDQTLQNIVDGITRSTDKNTGPDLFAQPPAAQPAPAPTPAEPAPKASKPKKAKQSETSRNGPPEEDAPYWAAINAKRREEEAHYRRMMDKGIPPTITRAEIEADPALMADPDVQAYLKAEDERLAMQAKPRPSQLKASHADLLDAPDTAFEDSTRKPQGTLAPQTEEVSTTQRRSIYEEAFRVAGLDPEEGILLPPAQKKNVLMRVLRGTFGFASVRAAANALTPDVVNQALDAYRNVRFMMHALALPVKGVSLNGTLNLALEAGNKGYFGVYRPASREIGMPGRSNSFAHEWAHALDHYLLDALGKSGKTPAQLLSHLARNEGLDVTHSIEEAFVNLIHKMFFNDAAVAAAALRLEQAAGETIQNGPRAGQPTQKALEAQKSLDRLKAGATRLQLTPSQFRANSAAYAPGDYYPSVHEMLARSFEAYVAHKVEGAGGTNEFITKGGANYLGSADRRLAMTFPKDHERLAIFAAWDQVMDHLRNDQVLGTDAPAEKPGDADIVDPQFWNKQVLAQPGDTLLDLLKKDGFAVRNAVRALTSREHATSAAKTFLENLGVSTSSFTLRQVANALDSVRLATFSMRGYINPRISRNKGQGADFMSYVWDKFAAQPGSISTHVGPVYEAEREAEAQKIAHRVESVMQVNLKGRLRLTAEENDTIRELLFGNKVPGASKSLVSIAAEFRRVMEDMHALARKAGVNMGYVADKGYLPRVIQTYRVQQDQQAFQRDAFKVYQIHFDNITQGIEPGDLLDMAGAIRVREEGLGRTPPFESERQALMAAVKALNKLPANATTQEVNRAQADVRAAMTDLKDALRDPWSDAAASDWTKNITAGNSLAFDSHGPGSSFTKARSLPSEADDILKSWYETDTLNLVMHYAQQATSKAAYTKRAGLVGGNEDLNQVIARKDVKDQLAFHGLDPAKPEDRLTILKRFANPKVDNILEMALNEASRAGAYGEDIRALRGAIETITGRRTRGTVANALDRMAGAAYLMTYLTLLPRAAITALTEPMTVMLRTGDVGATYRAFTAYASEAFRNAKSTKERAAIARAIGLTATQLHDSVLMSRLSADTGHMLSGNVLMARFFRANLLTQITNAQERAAMVAAYHWMRHMADRYDGTDRVHQKMIEAEFREMGVDERVQPDFRKWLLAGTDLPNLDDIESKGGKLFAEAAHAFTHQTIQKPHRTDKPIFASFPLGAVVYSLTGFLYSFYGHVHAATVTRAVRDYKIARDEGSGNFTAGLAATAPAVKSFAAGFSMIVAANVLTTVAREALFNPEQWKQHDKDKDLQQWLFGLALSRSGIFGPFDPLQNAMTGLRYQRDLANLFVGAGIASTMSNIQNILMLWSDRNSPNTNTTERTAAKSFYRLLIAPAATAFLSALELAGPLGYGARGAAMMEANSPGAASAFADMVAGPDNSKRHQS